MENKRTSRVREMGEGRSSKSKSLDDLLESTLPVDSKTLGFNLVWG